MSSAITSSRILQPVCMLPLQPFKRVSTIQSSKVPVKICQSTIPNAYFSQSYLKTNWYYELSRQILKEYNIYIVPQPTLCLFEIDQLRVIPIIDWCTYFAEAPENKAGGPVRQSGGGIGKLDAANEAGFFHKTNKSRLEEIKRKLKDKALLKGTSAPPKKVDPPQ